MAETATASAPSVIAPAAVSEQAFVVGEVGRGGEAVACEEGGDDGDGGGDGTTATGDG